MKLSSWARKSPSFELGVRLVVLLIARKQKISLIRRNVAQEAIQLCLMLFAGFPIDLAARHAQSRQGATVDRFRSQSWRGIR